MAATTRTSTLIGLVAAELGELRVLEDVQQLGLQRRLHLADLVEEDRAGVRLLELADPRRRGAGERALLVAEQLALEELRGQRRAVDLDERPVLARRPLVDGAGHQLLADAALAADEHRDVAVGHLLDDRARSPSCRGCRPRRGTPDPGRRSAGGAAR